MGFAGCLGCALIAGGPGLAVFSVFVAPKSFLVLLLLARCARRAAACSRRGPPPGAERRAARSLFAWLVSLTLTAARFRGAQPRPPGCGLPGAQGARARTPGARAGLVPLSEHRGALAAALVVGVAAQEATRYGAWLAHRRASFSYALEQARGRRSPAAGP